MGRWCVLALAAAATWSGCGSAGAFVCQSDADCQLSEIRGVCQPTGYCSFPDDTCDSGQRYGDHAADPLSETCVDPDDPATSEPTTADGSASAATPSTGPSTDPTADGATMSDDDTGSGSGTTDDATSGTRLQCQIDDFDDKELDPSWCIDTVPGIDIEEEDDHLWFELVPNTWRSSYQLGEVHSCDSFALLDSTVSVEIDHVPRESPHTGAYLEVGGDEQRIGLGAIDDMLQIYIYDDGGYSTVETLSYDDRAHRHWRVAGTPQGLRAETSANGADWVSSYTMSLDLEGEYGISKVGVWGEEAPMSSDFATYESIEICTAR